MWRDCFQPAEGLLPTPDLPPLLNLSGESPLMKRSAVTAEMNAANAPTPLPRPLAVIRLFLAKAPPSSLTLSQKKEAPGLIARGEKRRGQPARRLKPQFHFFSPYAALTLPRQRGAAEVGRLESPGAPESVRPEFSVWDFLVGWRWQWDGVGGAF